MTAPQDLHLTRNGNLWVVALAVATLLVIVLFVPAVTQMFGAPSIQYNEGWNAFFQQDAYLGKPLYATPPGLAPVAYPPLSFHLVGILAHISGDVNQTGRWLALCSLFLVACLCGAVVRYFTRCDPLAILTGITVLLWIGIYKPDRIGMNDPQLAGSVVALFALNVYIRYADRASGLVLSAAAFTIAIFTKHNLLAFPAATAIHLLLRREWRRFAIWTAALTGSAVIVCLLTWKIDGPYFLEYWLLPRTRTSNLADPVEYLKVFALPILLALIWCNRIKSWTMESIMAIAVFVAHVIAFAFAHGDGVDKNIYFDCMFSLVIVGALAFAHFQSQLAEIPMSAVRVGAAAAILVVPSVGLLGKFRETMLYEGGQLISLEARTADFNRAVNLIRSQEGDAMCEDPLVCFKAGKAFIYDTFTVKNMIIRQNVSRDRTVADFIAKPGFQSVQLKKPIDESHFTQRCMAAIRENYRVSADLNQITVLIPKLAERTN